jgi:hypothetical protein
MSEKRTTFGVFCKNFIKKLSIGKFNHGFYHNGDCHQSSVLGGILTVIGVLGIITFSVITIKNIVEVKEYQMEESVIAIDEDPDIG